MWQSPVLTSLFLTSAIRERLSKSQLYHSTYAHTRRRFAFSSDFELEPGDSKSSEKAPIGGGADARPRAVNVIYDRANSNMDLSKIPAEWIEAAGGKEKAPVITHCGGGGRGQKAKDFLEAAGFGNVKNGGGPEDDECWAVFGDK